MSAGVALTIDLALGGAESQLSIKACRVREALSRPSSVEVDVATFEDLELDDLLGERVELRVTASGVSRRLSLHLGAARYTGTEAGALRFTLELHSPLWMLRHGTSTRKWKKLSAKEIVSSVLDEWRVEHRFDLSRETPRRNYCVQYEEDHFSFVSRLLEFEGIHYRFEPDGAMVLSDTSTNAPGDLGAFDLIEAAGALAHAAPAVFELTTHAEVATGKVTLNDFDWRKPSADLLRTHAAAVDPDLEHYHYPAGYRHGRDGETLARMRCEAMRVPAHTLRGKSSVLAFTPGFRLSIGDDTGAPFTGEYVLTAVEHAFVLSSEDPNLGVYHNQFEAIPANVPFRPNLEVQRPVVEGNHTAIVRGPRGAEIHTDEYGRFRAQFHWDRDATGTDADSRWLRLAQETGSGMTLARVGWEMSVAYVDGDPDRPIGMARHMNGVMPPIYRQPTNPTVMAVRTPTSPASGGYNEWRMNDAAGAMSVDVRAERDFTTKVENDKTERIGRDHVRVVQREVTHGVGRDSFVSVANDRKLVTNEHDVVQVGGDRTVSIGGSAKIHAGGGIGLQAEGTDVETVGSVRLTVAGGIHLPNPVDALKRYVPTKPGSNVSLGAAVQARAASALSSGASAGAASSLAGGLGGGVGAAAGALQSSASSAVAAAKSALPNPAAIASQLKGTIGSLDMKSLSSLLSGSIGRRAKDKLTRSVGGVHLVVAAGGISTESKGDFVERVGGVRAALTKDGDITQSVDGPMALAVGGVVFRKATAGIRYSAKESEVFAGVSADLESKTSLTIRGNAITLEGKSKIVIGTSDGKAELALSPEGVHMRGNLAFQATEKVTVTGKKDNLAK